MGKEVPCYGCTERRAEHGYNCHMDCPRYKQFHESRVAKLEKENKKRAEEAMITDTRMKSLDRITGEKRKMNVWKG